MKSHKCSVCGESFPLEEIVFCDTRPYCDACYHRTVPEKGDFLEVTG